MGSVVALVLWALTTAAMVRRKRRDEAELTTARKAAADALRRAELAEAELVATRQLVASKLHEKLDAGFAGVITKMIDALEEVATRNRVANLRTVRKLASAFEVRKSSERGGAASKALVLTDEEQKHVREGRGKAGG